MILNVLLLLLLSSGDIQSGNHHIPPAKIKIVPGSAIEANKPQLINESDTDTLASKVINAKRSRADELVGFAEKLQGIPYKFGSTDPSIGFDCSGFINYVFNHFGISVPRSSREFSYIKKEITLKEARPGDIILFTGTDSTKRVVGHMGIITSDKGQSHEFIHSTSGKAYSVTKTPLNRYYQGRFMKVIRILKENEI